MTSATGVREPDSAPADRAALDRARIAQALELAFAARAAGNRPFGALLTDAGGRVLLTATNTAVTDEDVTAHAETNLVRAASALRLPGGLAATTLYTSTEPCLMCAGAIYLAGIGRVIFALAAAELAALPGTEAVRAVPVTLAAAVRAGDGRPVVEHLPTGDELGPHRGYWAGRS